MQMMEELKAEGQQFLDGGYQELDEPAKMIANSYMRGLKDGKRLAETAEERKEVG